MDAESKEDVNHETKEEVKQEELVKQENDVKQENGDVSITDELIKEKLKCLLEEADLAVVTEKMLRKSLEEQLGAKLGDKKALIRQEVLDYLEAKRQEEDGNDDEAEEDQQQEEAEEEAEEEAAEPKKKRRNTGNNFGGAYLSEQLQAFLGVESMARTQVVKALWAYIKENNLQDPKNKQKIIVDEKLATLFKPPLNMLNLNKQLSRHVYGKDGPRPVQEEEEEESDGDDGSDGSDSDGGRVGKKRAAAKPAMSKRSKKARGNADKDGEKPKRASGFSKPLLLSEELAAATGVKEMTRGGVVKWVFAYAREKDLFDPADKRYVKSDAVLKQLTGQSRFIAFGCQKLFGKHFIKQ